jgi:hypothetical protein
VFQAVIVTVRRSLACRCRRPGRVFRLLQQSRPRFPTRLADRPFLNSRHAEIRLNSDLVLLVRAAIDAEPYRIGPRISRWRLLLAKLEPQDEPALTPYPAPRPSGEPSFVYAKLTGVRRRRR